MSTQDNNSLEALIQRKGLKIGNEVLGTDCLPVSANQGLYVDSDKKLASAFVLPLNAGVVSTSYSVLSIRGQATGTANDLMHLTLVKGANATATIAGYARITVTDDAGVITTGDYYAPFYTLA